ncbi:bacteriocin [Vibrio vulnificus]|nr:bacteriocin [Vibrio vulnificus]EGQ8092346.1 bacteriocin [Vibrio vulnificus]EGQ8093489.1 bacteriocin [Vibrio vulnificus]EHH0745743.1 bacteriocin [Vibrio vulnificus]EHH0747342.1 bacteriocin [Vibrio vulnificus]EIO4057835.1 bacteriocin [Vibrio vulnificus]
MEVHQHPTRPAQYVGRKAIYRAASSTHLVDMELRRSLNEIQRLPGKKLAISFNGSTILVDELDVKVVGRVAIVIERV